MPNYPSTSLDTYESRNRKGRPNGYASLGPDGKVPASQIVDDDGVGGAMGGGGVSPSATVVAETQTALNPTPGVATNYSRGDHAHGTPDGAFPSVSVISEVTAGQGVSAGASPFFSRGDHTHGTPPGTVQSVAAPATTTGGTIATAGLTISRVAPVSTVTGVILAPGGSNPATIYVVNESAFALTFAGIGTSNVSIGTQCSIPAMLAMPFIWDSGTMLWYPLGNINGGGPVTSTTYTFTGPASGMVNTISTNFTVAVSPVGSSCAATTTITPAVSGVAGTFTPASVSFAGLFVNAQATFKFTPTATGTATLSVTNSGGLTNPANLTYTVATGGSGRYGTGLYGTAVYG